MILEFKIKQGKYLNDLKVNVEKKNGELECLFMYINGQEITGSQIKGYFKNHYDEIVGEHNKQE